VAIAQLDSLRSWSAYVDRLLGNVSLVSNIIPPLGRALHALSRAWHGVNTGLQSGLPALEGGLSRWNVDVLLHAQGLAQQQAVIAAADLAERTARATVPEARVSRLTAALQVQNASGFARYSQIRRRGDGELRPYLQLLAAARDGFSARRSFDLAPANPVATLPKRGGTELIGEYAWRGADTLASHINLILDDFELPIGWGAAESHRHVQLRSGEHGGSARDNPRSTRLAMAVSAARQGYRGVPEFRDLRGTPDEEAARLRYLVALEMPRDAVRTADSVLSIRGIEDPSGVEHDVGSRLRVPLQALGAAEIYFRRPDARSDGLAERPSLFSPYWQARLAVRPAGGLRLLAGSAR
jgi:hypothetical protein